MTGSENHTPVKVGKEGTEAPHERDCGPLAEGRCLWYNPGGSLQGSPYRLFLTRLVHVPACQVLLPMLTTCSHGDDVPHKAEDAAKRPTSRHLSLCLLSPTCGIDGETVFGTAKLIRLNEQYGRLSSYSR
jgi:hypothetical protein